MMPLTRPSLSHSLVSLSLALASAACLPALAVAQQKPPAPVLIPESTQRTFAPIPAGDWTDAELILNNNAIVSRVVHVTLFSRGAAVRLRDLALPASTATFLSLSEIVPAGFDHRLADAIELDSVGRQLEIGAQLSLLRPHRGSVDIPFSMAGDYRSSTMHAVWSNKSGGRRIVVANTTGSAVTVSLTGEDGLSQRIELTAHESRTIPEPARAPGSQRPATNSLKISAIGPPGAVRAFGYCEGPNGRFGGYISFYDPAAARRSSLFATNVVLKHAIPVLTIRNVSDAPVVVTPRLTEAGDGGVSIDEESISLAPEESKVVPLTRIAATARTERGSLAVISNGAPGAIIGSVSSLPSDGDAVFEAPLRDPGPANHSTGSYPWRIDGDYETTLSITNVSASTAQYRAFFTYAGGAFPLDPVELQPGQTTLIDAREVAARIPSHPTSGQFRWSIVNSQGQTKLIGRAELTSKREGRVSSYSCWTCCGWASLAGYFSPGLLPVNINTAGFASITEYFQDCYGYQTPAFAAFPEWWNVSNWGVAGVWTAGWGSAEADGYNGGTVSSIGNWYSEQWVQQWVDEADPLCLFLPYVQTAPGYVKVRKPTSLLTVYDDYVAHAGYRYWRQRVYNILDQEGQVMTGNLNVSETFSPNPPNGNCTYNAIETPTAFAPGGNFPDHYALTEVPIPPDPCASFATQTHYVNGFQVSNIQVFYHRNDVELVGP